ncbi:MAG TPA: FAD-dependent oxidoreductase [Pirellulales bacterium]|nr:FAD-dependent oxidoreductase [Pirellulales bacterium]
MTQDQRETETVVVGAGAAGLTAAACLVRAGRKVTVLEKSRVCGGRARTRNQDGFQFNVGPHALYLNGAGRQILAELQIPVQGSPPPHGHALRGEKLYPLPRTAAGLWRSSLFSLAGKWAVTRFLASLSKVSTRELQAVGFADWLAAHVRNEQAQQFLAATFRLATYTADLERLSAGAALEQFKMGTAGVLYLDGGWQTLIDGLQSFVQSRGGQVQTARSAAAIERDGEAIQIRLADGGRIVCRNVVLAADPQTVKELLPEAASCLSSGTERPVLAACLDVALSRLPEPGRLFALGIDQPLYFSVHSAVARLAPRDAAVIHVMKYLSQPADNSGIIERELELLLDRLQPGWREFVVQRRFLPSLTVAHRTVTAECGGLGGRPGPELPGIEGVYLAGDWIGPVGMLADASFASGRAAAECIVNQDRSRRTRSAASFRTAQSA